MPVNPSLRILGVILAALLAARVAAATRDAAPSAGDHDNRKTAAKHDLGDKHYAKPATGDHRKHTIDPSRNPRITRTRPDAR